MKRAIVTWLERLLAVAMMICVISGIILMLCESDDWNTQRTSLFFGFGLFILGILPGAIISWIETRKEKEEIGNF